MSSLMTGGECNPVEAPGEESLDRKRRGEPATAEDSAQAYPELADEILGLFPALMTMETLGGDASSDAPSITSVAESPAGGGTTPGRLGEYRILREIGRGGMGVVYEAEQESLGRRVALKVLPGHRLADVRQVRRFQREARSAARLHHTNIVPVFGVGQHDGVHFYVMQFIDGQGLDVILEELRPLRTARSHQGAGQGTVRQTPEGREAADLARSLATGRFAAERDGNDSSGLGGVSTPSDLSPERPDPEPQPAGSATPSPEIQSGISRLSRDRARLCRGSGADRRPGCRCPGLCPRTGDPPSRHQAVELAPGSRWQRLGHRLRPGQGRRGRRLDPHRRHHRHRALHGPGAVRRSRRCSGGSLRAGTLAL